jgi:cytochrome c oxidase assembly factor CtaG
MVQHLLLMVVAPPLLWLGAPVAPLLLGLPRPARRAVARVLAAKPLRQVGELLADPRVAWGLFVAAFWIWHLPAMYDLALRSDAWHHVEHACFFLTALAFWRPILSPWPARARWPHWAMIVYVLLAEAQNTLLSAILTFSDRVIYSAYASAGPSALDDQALAGVIMWVPGSAAFALALLWLVFKSLGSESRAQFSRPPLPASNKTAG